MLETLVVEDHPGLRSAMVAGLEATGAVRVVGEAGSGEAAIAWCEQQAPAAILMAAPQGAGPASPTLNVNPPVITCEPAASARQLTL